MKKTLVAYFSATGVTAEVAKRLAKAAHADIFEIRPKEPYTDADLDWTDRNSRTTLEMKDRNCRPPLAQQPDIKKYEVIFVGFPVWWYREPSIIDTFMQSADFSGKTIIPFATSGGSDLGDAAKNMQELAPQARVQTGQRFASAVPDQTLSDWVALWM